MHLSVVIPTFNRAQLLRRSIPALGSQRTDGFTYEVIFVSNGSTDETESVLVGAESDYPGVIRHFRIEPTGGPSAPRNVGIRAATGRVILLLDDDVVPDQDLVLRHAEFHQQFPESHHAALGELYVPAEMARHPMSMFHAFPYDEVRGLDRLGFYHFWTCNVSVKRDFIMAAGMFDETLLAYEDTVLGYGLVRQGMHLHFVPTARGQHLHQMEPSGVATKGLWYGRWQYTLEQQVPERVVKERYGILSLDIGLFTLSKRLVRRLGFRIVDNPLTLLCLRWLGADRPTRTRVSDAYYFLIFRHHLLKGYYEAKRLARAPGTFSRNRALLEWTDRGEG